MAITDPYSRDAAKGQEPPASFFGTLRHLGPGMIIVASVVGSGELIVTTKLGAVAGFVFLWFVLRAFGPPWLFLCGNHLFI